MARISKRKMRKVCRHPVLLAMQEDQHVNDLTLRYFSNKDYATRVKKEREKNIDADVSLRTGRKRRKEYKFYQKRVVDLTRKLLLYKPEHGQEECDALPHRVQDAFSCFANQCIDYFQSLDKSDLLQRDLKITEEEHDNSLFSEERRDAHTEGFDYKAVDVDFVKSLTHTPKQNTLTRFVMRKDTQTELAPVHAPQHRDVNLQDPALKHKGLGKKKNVESTYEDIHEPQIPTPSQQQHDQYTSKAKEHTKGKENKKSRDKKGKRDKKDKKDKKNNRDKKDAA